MQNDDFGKEYLNAFRERLKEIGSQAEVVASLPAKIAQSGIASPALIIVGDVVALSSRLGWFRSVEEVAVTSDAQQ